MVLCIIVDEQLTVTQQPVLTGEGALFKAAGFVSGEVDSDEEDMETTAAERQKRLQAATEGAADTKTMTMLSFEIKQKMVEDVKKECLMADPPLPMLSEYDFNNDFDNHDLPISLRPEVAIRS